MLGDDPDIRELVEAAAAGDQLAWNSLVTRYTPLVLSIARRYPLDSEDLADVSQTLWLTLLRSLRSLRDPQALPGWIAVTTRNECFRVLRGNQRTRPFDPTDPTSIETSGRDVVVHLDLDRGLLRAERHEALLVALAELSDLQRRLLLALMEEPTPSYAEISARLGIPVGGIGPTRARAVDRLRRSPQFAALLQDQDQSDDLQRSGR